MDVLRVSISGSLVNELHEYVGTVAIVAFFVPFFTFEPKKYFLEFVNYVRYIEKDLKNNATPETLETTCSSSRHQQQLGWQQQQRPYPDLRPPRRNNCNEKNSNSRTDSSTAH